MGFINSGPKYGYCNGRYIWPNGVGIENCRGNHARVRHPDVRAWACGCICHVQGTLPPDETDAETWARRAKMEVS